MTMHYTGELILQPLLCSSGGRCYVIIHCHLARFRNALCNAVLRGIGRFGTVGMVELEVALTGQVGPHQVPFSVTDIWSCLG